MKEILLILVMMVLGMPSGVDAPTEESHVILDREAERVTIVAIKSEKLVEVWYENEEHLWLEETYPIVTSSGIAGPKLRQGDKQTPEGVYEIVSINTASQYDIFMLLNFPNDFDRQKAKDDGRTNLGGSIGIHGGDYSVGCLAVGDAIEAIYDHVMLVGMENTRLVIVPYDFRDMPYAAGSASGWVDDLYLVLDGVLDAYKE